MYIHESQELVGRLEEYAQHGGDLVGRLVQYTEENLPSLKPERLSPCKMKASFFGVSLIARVELRCTEGQPSGSITACAHSHESEPREIPLVKYDFAKYNTPDLPWVVWNSKLGNPSEQEVENTTRSFPEAFWAEIFDLFIIDQTSILRP